MSSSQAPARGDANTQAADATQTFAASPSRRRRQNGAALLLRALALARGPAGAFLLGGDPDIDMGILASPDAVSSAVVHAGTRNAMTSTGAHGSTVDVCAMFVPFVNLGVICVGLLVETAQVQTNDRGLRPETVRNEAMSRYALNTETGEMLRVRNSVSPASEFVLQWTGVPIGDHVRERITFECDRRLFAAGRLEDSVTRFQRSTRVGGGACAGVKASGPRDMARSAENLAHNTGLVHEFVGGMPTLRENFRRVDDGAERYKLLVAAVQGHATMAGPEPSGGMTADLHAVAMGLGAERVKLAKAQRARRDRMTAGYAPGNVLALGKNRQAMVGSRSDAGHQQHEVVLEDGMGGKLDLNELEFAASDLTYSPDQSSWCPSSPRATSKDTTPSVELNVGPSLFHTTLVSDGTARAPASSRLPPNPGSTTAERASKVSGRPQDATGTTRQLAPVTGDFSEDGGVSHITEPSSHVIAQRPHAATAAAAQYAMVSDAAGYVNGAHLSHDADDRYGGGGGYQDDFEEEVDSAMQNEDMTARSWEAEQTRQAAAVAAAELVDRERQEQVEAANLKRKMARREYNLAAAKRSNQRRREAYENLVNGLKEAHARANELRELENKLRAKNIELRRLVRQTPARPSVAVPERSDTAPGDKHESENI